MQSLVSGVSYKSYSLVIHFNLGTFKAIWWYPSHDTIKENLMGQECNSLLSKTLIYFLGNQYFHI